MNRSWRTFLETVALAGSFFANPAIKFMSIGLGIIISSLPVRRRQAEYKGETYTWTHKANRTAAEGTPMPVIYGRTRVKPVLKNRYIRMQGDKQVLYALYGFACHSIDQRDVEQWSLGKVYAAGDEVGYSVTPGKTYVCTKVHRAGVSRSKFSGIWTAPITDTDFWKPGPGTADITGILLNGRSIDTYSGIEYETRPGLPVQSMITGFDKTYSNFPQSNASVNMAVPVPLLQRGVVVLRHGICFRHQVYYAGKLYWVKANNKLGLGKVYWTPPEINEVESEYTTTPGTFEICDFHNSFDDDDTTWGFMQAFPSSDGDWTVVDISVATTQNIQVDLCLPNGLFAAGTGTNTAGKTYPSPCRLFLQYRRRYNSGLWGTWLSFPFVVEDAVAPTSSLVHGADVVLNRTALETVYLSYMARVEDVDTLLEKSEYQVRVAAVAPADVELTNVAGVTYGEFTYPGEPLLGIRALASDKLSGDIEVTGVCDRGTVWVRNASSWVLKSANNAAWVVYDILAQGHAQHPTLAKSDGIREQSRYGCGIVYSKLDYTSFNTWANFLSDNDYHCNTVFDEWTTAWDAVLRVCGEFRGMVTPVGTRYYALVDKPETPGQLFSMGNILKGSFSQTWPNRDSRAGSMEITYFDKDRGYDAVTILLRGEKWQELDPTRITLYGTTDYEQAYTIATYFMNCNELLEAAVEFDVGAGELQVGVGDVVWVQHDVPQWGRGGRVVSFQTGIPVPGTDSIGLDLTMTYESGNTYEIILRHSLTDTVERQTITNPAGDSAYARTASGVWSIPPAAGDVFAIGIVADGEEVRVQPYRVIDVRRGSNLSKRLTLLEYNPDVYTPAAQLPVIGLPKVAPSTFNEAVNVRAVEKITPRTTGEYEPGIEVTWDAVQGDVWGEWEVVYRDVDSADTGWKGDFVAGTVYGMFDKVQYDGKTYMSLVDGNTSRPITLQ